MYVVVQCVFMCLHSIGSQMLKHGRRAEGSQDVAQGKPENSFGPMFYLEGDENLKHKAVSGFEAVHYYSRNDFSLIFINFVILKKLESFKIQKCVILNATCC